MTPDKRTITEMDDAELDAHIDALWAEEDRLWDLRERDREMLYATGPCPQPHGKLRLRITRTKEKIKKHTRRCFAAEAERDRRQYEAWGDQEEDVAMSADPVPSAPWCIVTPDSVGDAARVDHSAHAEGRPEIAE